MALNSLFIDHLLASELHFKQHPNCIILPDYQIIMDIGKIQHSETRDVQYLLVWHRSHGLRGNL